MKKVYSLIASAFISALFLASCSQDSDFVISEDIESELSTPADDGINATIESEKELTLEEYANLVYGDDPEKAQEKADFIEYKKVQADSVAQVTGQNGIANAFKLVTFSYTSETKRMGSYNGTFYNRRTHKAYMAWGYWKGIFKSYQLDIDRIILSCHYTITSNAECPTEQKTSSMDYKLGLTKDNLLIVPDYTGFGATKDLPQPYLCHDLYAKNIIDGYKAAISLFEKSYSGKYEKNCEFIVVGASQGGANAFATHRYIEANASSIPHSNWFKYSHCAAGPYLPSKTFSTYLEWKKLSYPCVLPLVIKSMVQNNPDIFRGISEKDFFTDEYNKHFDEIDYAIESKKYKSGEINDIMFKYFGKKILLKNYVYIDRVLKADVINANGTLHNKMMQALGRYDLNKGWRPTHKAKLIHSKKDEVVPVENAYAVNSTYGSTLCPVDYKQLLNHTATCVAFYALPW